MILKTKTKNKKVYSQKTQHEKKKEVRHSFSGLLRHRHRPRPPRVIEGN